MKKIIIFTMLSLFLFAASSSASPLNDFSLGKAALDLGIISSKIDVGATLGLGYNFGLQYKYQNAKHSASMQEINLLYKLDKNFNVFAGSNSFHRASQDKRELQLGITGATVLADKINGWTTLAGGNHNKTFEIGVGYDLMADTEIHVLYRYKEFGSIHDDGEHKGFGAGVTFKF